MLRVPTLVWSARSVLLTLPMLLCPPAERDGRKRADSFSRSLRDATGTWKKETVKVDVTGMSV